ncbi:hypothetical protein [Polaribacter sp. M15]
MKEVFKEVLKKPFLNFLISKRGCLKSIKACHSDSNVEIIFFVMKGIDFSTLLKMTYKSACQTAFFRVPNGVSILRSFSSKLRFYDISRALCI